MNSHRSRNPSTIGDAITAVLTDTPQTTSEINLARRTYQGTGELHPSGTGATMAVLMRFEAAGKVVRSFNENGAKCWRRSG